MGATGAHQGHACVRTASVSKGSRIAALAALAPPSAAPMAQAKMDAVRDSVQRSVEDFDMKVMRPLQARATHN